MLFVLFLISWYIFGVYNFIYWWTSAYDFRLKDIFKALLFGILGPIIAIFPFIYMFNDDYSTNSIILIKCRK